MASNTIGMDSLEYKTLNQCYPDLVLCIQQAPNDIVDHLRPLDILAQGDANFLQNPHNSKDDKARRIVDIVLNQVKRNTEVYERFIKALKLCEWTNVTVCKLQETQRLLSVSIVSERNLPEESSSGKYL